MKSFISAARKHDIGVLLNVQAPSLPNTTTVVNPWEDSKYRALFRKLIQYITQQSVSSLVLNQAIIGLQFVIDSQLPLTGLLAGEFYSWYDEIVDLIHSINPQLPIYVPASNSRDATLVSDSLHGRPLSGEFVSHHTMRGSSTEIENQRNPVFTITSTERPISGAANASLRGQEVVQNNDTVEDGDVKFTGCAIGVLSAPVQSLFEQDPFFQHASLRRGSLGHNEINASVMKHAESNAGVHSLGGYFWDLKAVS